MTPPDVTGRPAEHRPWLMRMRWHDLLFAHWRVDPRALAALVPAPLELETFDGSAWLGVVPFRMSDVAPRWLPAVPGISAFPEVNVRTYVRHAGRSGVLFLSLDAGDRLAVAVAHRLFGLPYFHAVMQMHEGPDRWIDFRSERTRDPRVAFHGRYRSRGVGREAPDGSLAAFLTARSGLWTVDMGGRPRWSAIRHAPWPLETAEADMDDVSLAAAAGVPITGQPDDLAFSRRLDVVAWLPTKADG